MNWIDANDRIPDNGRYVLACRKVPAGQNQNFYFEIGYFDGGKDCFYEQHECRLYEDVEFWMELDM